MDTFQRVQTPSMLNGKIENSMRGFQQGVESFLAESPLAGGYNESI